MKNIQSENLWPEYWGILPFVILPLKYCKEVINDGDLPFVPSINFEVVIVKSRTHNGFYLCKLLRSIILIHHGDQTHRWKEQNEPNCRCSLLPEADFFHIFLQSLVVIVHGIRPSYNGVLSSPKILRSESHGLKLTKQFATSAPWNLMVQVIKARAFPKQFREPVVIFWAVKRLWDIELK